MASPNALSQSDAGRFFSAGSFLSAFEASGQVKEAANDASYRATRFGVAEPSSAEFDEVQILCRRIVEIPKKSSRLYRPCEERTSAKSDFFVVVGCGQPMRHLQITSRALPVLSQTMQSGGSSGAETARF